MNKFNLLKNKLIIREEEKAILFYELDSDTFDYACDLVEEMYDTISVKIIPVLFNDHEYTKIKGI